MIDLTRKQFDGFCQLMNVDSDLMIITKALFTVDVDNVLGYSTVEVQGEHGKEFKNIIAVKSEDFTSYKWYTTVRPPYLTWADETTHGTGQMTFDANSNYFKFSPNSQYFNLDTRETHEFVIVYYLDNGVTTSATNIFTNVDLVSIDYVGNKINEIGFSTDFPHLKEINLYNNLHYKYDGLLSVNEQTLNFANGFDVTSSNPNILLGNYNNIALSPGAFAGAPIKKMVFPNSLTPYTIPPNCFAGCTQLEEVYIPDAVTAIGANAFKGCTKLNYIYIGANVTTIETGAFDGCTGESPTSVVDFETSVNNTRFIGERGCLLRKNITSIDGENYMTIGGAPAVPITNNTYTVVHATNCWFHSSGDAGGVHRGISRCKYVSVSDFPSWASGEKPNYGMMLIDGGGGKQVTDIHGEVYTNCTEVTRDNYDTIYSSHQTIADSFLVPIYYLIEAIGDNACINDPFMGLGSTTHLSYWNLHTIYFSDPVSSVTIYAPITWYSLKYIGKNAFKGCNLRHLVLPKNNSDDYGHTGVRGSLYSTIYLDNSAFENCVILNELNITKETYFANKVFFGCTALTSVDFGNYPPATIAEFNEVDGSYTQGVNGDPDTYNIGYLTFGNTPNLQSITCSVQTDTIRNNAIIAINTNNVMSGILVGCKSTDLSTTLIQSVRYIKIYEGAFYGCSQMTVSSGSSDPTRFLVGAGITHIGRNAFYGCVSLVSTTQNPIEFHSHCYIYEKAFYGCTGIQYLLLENSSTQNIKTKLYSKAFGNSGVKNINIVNNRVELMASDVFDGCVLNSVYVGIPPSGETNQLIGSSPSIENALISRLGTYTSSDENLAIIKSGDGKNIVNTIYTSNNIYEIKSGAFNGVIMNDVNSDNRLIHIPKTVNKIGSNILTDSKTVNNQGQTITNCNLQLNGDYYAAVGIQNTELSTGLLYYVGGRYFRNVVENTVPYIGQYHYYRVIEGGDEYGPMLILAAMSDEGVKMFDILRIGYDTYQNVVLNIWGALDSNYMDEDNDAHVHAIDEIILVLMYGGQKFTSGEINVYCDPYLVPGSIWLKGTPLEVTIPYDVPESEPLAYHPYSQVGTGAFSNCKWAETVTTKRLLNNLTDGFKGCTNLITINAGDYENGIDLSIFDGSVPNGMFDGCINFTGVVPSHPEILTRNLIVYGDNSFNGCTSFVDSEKLMYGAKFGKQSFANTGLTAIDLVSVGYDNDNIYHGLDPQAFNGCSLSYATAHSTCGYYFTGADNASIIDKNKKIIVGSYNSDISNFSPTSGEYIPNFFGIGPYAFYGRNFPWGSENEEVYTDISYTIGESAFSTSTINKWMENEEVAGNTGTKNYGKNAFKECAYLTKVLIHGKVNLGEGIFEGCTSLNRADIPLGTDIPIKAFAKCTSLPVFVCSGSIGENAFNGCSSLTSIYLHYNGASNVTVAPTAFIGCPISRIHTENDEESIYTNDGIYMLDTYNVFKCNNDGHIELVVGCNTYNTLTTVMDSSKWKVRLKVIGKHAYNGRGLSGEIVIPSTVTKIDDYAFANNPGITYVNIPPTVEYIGAHAFDGCTNIESISLPDSCTFIGEGAFKGCSLNKGFNCNAEDKRYYSSVQIQATEYSPTFTKFNGSIDLTNAPYIHIAENCFKNTGIKMIRLPKTCVWVDANAFYSCTQLVEFHFTRPNDTVDVLSADTFYGCINLADIYLDNGAFPNIDPGAFNTVGSGVPSGHRHIHAPASFKNNPNWLNSSFKNILTGTNGFTVEYDL